MLIITDLYVNHSANETLTRSIYAHFFYSIDYESCYNNFLSEVNVSLAK